MKINNWDTETALNFVKQREVPFNCKLLQSSRVSAQAVGIYRQMKVLENNSTYSSIAITTRRPIYPPTELGKQRWSEILLSQFDVLNPGILYIIMAFNEDRENVGRLSYVAKFHLPPFVYRALDFLGLQELMVC
jgi:hypothetical protein